MQQLRGLCSAGGARSTSFGELLGSRPPLEAALLQPPSPPSERLLLEALAQPPSKKLRWSRRFSTSSSFGCCWRRSCSTCCELPLEALAQPPLESSSGCRWRRFSTSLSFRCCWRRSLNLLAAVAADLLRRAPWASIALPVQCFIKAGPLRRISSLLTASRPRFRPRPPDCKFIKAAPTERADPQSSIEAGPDGQFIKASPQWQFYQGLQPVYQGQPQPEGPTPRSGPRRPNPLLRRTSSLSTAGRPRSSIEAGPGGQFSKAPMAPEGPTPRSSPWRVNPLLRHTSSLSTAGRPWSSIEAGPDGQFIKASPQWPRRPNPLLRRTSSLSTAGRSPQSRPAPMASLSQWPFYQGFSQFFQTSSNQKGRPPDLALGGPIRYCAAQAVYQRPAGHGLQSRPAPMASLSRPVPMAPEGPTPRSSPWRVNPLLRRTSSLSTAGRPWSSFETGPDGQFIKASPQWPLYQGL